MFLKKGKVHQKCITSASRMRRKMCDSFSKFLEFDTGGRRRNVQILLRNVKKLACGTCQRICPLLQHVHTMKEK